MVRVTILSRPTPIQPEMVTVKYGLLYNWYAATDARLICADGWEVPEKTDWETLQSYLGGEAISGLKMKEIGIEFWASDNGSTNESGFNGRSGSHRFGSTGSFALPLNGSGNFMSITHDAGSTIYAGKLAATWESFLINTLTIHNIKNGLSIRLLKTTTTLTNGQTGTYTGNDGKVYRTICIGTQEWLADNLCETKFRNGDYIPGYDGGVYTPFTNSAWAALTTAGVCCYNDDTDNI